MRVVNKYKGINNFFLTENTMPVNFSESASAVDFFLNTEIEIDLELELQAELEDELELCL